MDESLDLPGREELYGLLLKVDARPIMINNFYPEILKQAGEKFNCESITMLLIIATNLYEFNTSQSMRNSLEGQMPCFINAIINNNKAAKLVEQLYKWAVKPSN